MERFDGVYGALVIREPVEADVNGHLYDYDKAENHLVLGDWTNIASETFVTGLRSTPFYVDSVLVDGHGTYIDPKTNVSTFAPLTVLYLEHDKRYRFRLIGATCLDCPLEFCVCTF